MAELSGKRIVVTGGGGFIGWRSVQSLLTAGAKVIALVDSSGQAKRLEETAATVLVVPEWEKEALLGILEGVRPEYILHLRAAVNPAPTAKESNKQLFRTNFEGTKVIAEAARAVGTVKRFLHVGTIAEYGGITAPFKEENPGQPISDYGKSKLAATEYLQGLDKAGQLPTVIVRLSVVYGPGQRPHSYFIPAVIRHCIEKKVFHIDTNGKQTRDPLFVSDAVKGVLAALTVPGVEGEIINLGLGEEHTIREIAATINLLAGSPIAVTVGNEPNRAGENDHYWHDIQKAKRRLRWEPAVSLTAGLAQTIKWYQEHSDIFT